MQKNINRYVIIHAVIINIFCSYTVKSDILLTV